MKVDFYFGPGSRYSYLAALQVGRISAETGALFRWVPVLSGDLLARTGGVHRSPQDPTYRTIDVERWARHYDVPFHDIVVEVDWARWAIACTAAQRLGRAEPFALALYQRAYGQGHPPLNSDDLGSVALAADLDVAAFRSACASGQTIAAYQDNLDAALAAGAFGVPTFVAESGELFWGQDRLPLLVDHLKGRSG
jgi:2-hydroxychromene-2-carboxylate isomerase